MPPPPADTTAPKLDLTAKKSAKLGKAVTVTAGCDEACTASATGKIAVKSGGVEEGQEHQAQVSERFDRCRADRQAQAQALKELAQEGEGGAQRWRQAEGEDQRKGVRLRSKHEHRRARGEAPLMRKGALLAGCVAALAIAAPAAAAPVAELAVDVEPGASGSSPLDFTAVGDSILFVANVGTTGEELWRTNGTATGTALVKDINPAPFTGSGPERLAAVGSVLYFAANDGTNGTEVWRSDGTAEGTAMVKDIKLGDGSSNPGPFFEHAGFVYFQADDGVNGSELWRTDGATTEMVANINGGSFSSSPAEFATLGDFLYFQADAGTRGTELWRTDGTSANTDQVENINSTAVGADSSPRGLTRFGNFLYFQADDGTNGTELFRTNGAIGNASQVANISPGINSSLPNGFTPFGNFLYFSAQEGFNGYELWRTDGSSTTRVKEIDPRDGAGSSPDEFTIFGGLLYFRATDENGTELWRTDGTETGTTLFANINTGGANGSDGSFPANLTVLGDSLYFRAEVASSGEELWRTDGTSTALFADILPGKENGAPGPFTKVGDALYFKADDGVHGREPWRLGEPLPPPQPPADTTAPKLDLDAKKSQKLDKSVEVTVGCDEACAASATGKIAVKSGGGSKKGKSIKLKAASAPVVAGQTATLKLKLSKKSLKKAAAALKAGAKLKAKIAVSVTDAASNASTDTLRVKLH